MKDYTLPIRLIHILSDGKVYSKIQLSCYMGITCLEVINLIEMLKEWNIHICVLDHEYYRFACAMQLLNERKINQELLGGRLVVIPILNSTNQYLLDAVSGLKSGDVCAAEYQRNGRGRHGAQWFSPFGSNLYFSMYWRLDQSLKAPAIGLSRLISIVIAKVLQQKGASDIRVKWPNDIYLYDRKLAGVLVEIKKNTENALDVVIGAGINISMKKLANSIFIKNSWIDLQETGMSIDKNSLLVSIINTMYIALKKFERQGMTMWYQSTVYMDNYINDLLARIISDDKPNRMINQTTSNQSEKILLFY
ncbi:Bifunctional ligase/repressor BirA [Candidatus Erwinia haradaeae]|uniref:Bifunctional ligase/repressor BirA, partial n=1 Tax=Candidatus Erwinia haradaeae TaxID=1922217 RepID=A0A451DJK7_9GAMM|nr:biotin--[acetyl-CoA-carboxylase] ligase [Candidatus Erwinia haradaeae]VFP86892.1 Bifunctional ligase/repressor BirA [Candidatus Erwinia haradaeae]